MMHNTFGAVVVAIFEVFSLVAVLLATVVYELDRNLDTDNRFRVAVVVVAFEVVTVVACSSSSGGNR